MTKLTLLLSLGLWHGSALAQSAPESDITCPRDDENAVFTVEQSELKDDAIMQVQCADGVVRRVEGVRAGKRHGDNLLYTAEGQLVRHLTFKDGQRHGEVREWDAEGNLTRTATYKSGVLHGEDRRYAASGDLEFKGSYNEGTPIGTHEFYDMPGNLSLTQVYNDEGELISEERRDDAGRIIATKDTIASAYGPALQTKRYYQSGEPKQVITKARNGRWQLRQGYAEDGTLTERVEHLDGKQTGDFVRLSWGGLKEYGHYNEGELHGPYRSENDRGEVMSEGEYRAATKVGRWVEQTEHEKFIAHYNQQGEFEGVREEYDADGNLVMRQHYNNGVLHGDYLRYRDDLMIAKGTFVQGKRDGDWILSLFYSGGLIQHGEYDMDKQIGRWDTFDEAGHLRAVSQYNDKGQLHGRHIDFEENGAIRVVKEYHEGVEHGVRVYYFLGSPDRAVRYKNGGYEEELDIDVVEALF